MFLSFSEMISCISLLALVLELTATVPGPLVVMVTGKLVWTKAAITLVLVLSVSVCGLAVPVSAPVNPLSDQSLAGIAVIGRTVHRRLRGSSAQGARRRGLCREHGLCFYERSWLPLHDAQLGVQAQRPK
jgi:hypothetical protein